MQTAPVMNRVHKENRLTQACNQVIYTQNDWRNVVLSDEENATWMVMMEMPTIGMMRTDERIFSKRKHGGGSVRIWDCFRFYGRNPIQFLDRRQDSRCYVDLMAGVMLPIAHKCQEEE